MNSQIGLYEMFGNFNNLTLPEYLENKFNAHMEIKEGNYIYWLIDKNNLVYIGKTNCITARLGEHSRSKKEFDQCLWANVNPSDIDLIENFLIDVFNPKYNKTNNFMHRRFLGGLAMISTDFIEQTYNLQENIKDGHNRSLSECEKINRYNCHITLLNLNRMTNPIDDSWIFVDKIMKSDNNDYVIIPKYKK